MKRNRYSSILALYAFACIVLFSAAAGLAAVETSITGTVYADDWDDKGNVTLVVIETADGEIYYVSDDAKGFPYFLVTLSNFLSRDPAKSLPKEDCPSIQRALTRNGKK